MQSTRRGFIQQSAAMVAATSAPWLTNLAAISNADAATTGDYKALVCLFMFGGNDHANAVVPFDDASYATYKAQRPNLYHQANTLLMGDQSASMPGFFRPTGAPAGRATDDFRCPTKVCAFPAIDRAVRPLHIQQTRRAAQRGHTA